MLGTAENGRIGGNKVSRVSSVTAVCTDQRKYLGKGLNCGLAMWLNDYRDSTHDS